MHFNKMPPIKYPLKTKNKSTPIAPINLTESKNKEVSSGNNKNEQ